MYAICAGAPPPFCIHWAHKGAKWSCVCRIVMLMSAPGVRVRVVLGYVWVCVLGYVWVCVSVCVCFV